MHLKYRNVNEAFLELVGMFNVAKDVKIEAAAMLQRQQCVLRKQPSRNGEVLRIMEPVTITYTRPWERVLMSSGRDCNPFFHLFESLWMLAGKNDVESLAYFNSGMANYSDNGKIFHGAYGDRWRNWPVADFSSKTGIPAYVYMDQLKEIIQELKADRHSRRVVLQMWDPPRDLGRETKDKPCNLVVTFDIRDETSDMRPIVVVPYLDMTVFNRSNDLIWGSLGANVVHFSFLQEFLAAKLDIHPGHYHQISNNLHTYLNKFEPSKWLDSEYTSRDWYAVTDKVHHTQLNDLEFPEVEKFVEEWQKPSVWDHAFLQTTAYPMMQAFRFHKNRDYNNAFSAIRAVKDDDWRDAGYQWLSKRRRWYEARQDQA